MLKTVSFDVPYTPPRQRAATAPAKRSKQYSSASQQSAPSSTFSGAKPDLIADIMDRPKTAVIKSEFSRNVAKNKTSFPTGGGGVAAMNVNSAVIDDLKKLKTSSITNSRNLSLREETASTKGVGAGKSPVKHAEKQRIISGNNSKGKISSNPQVMHMTRRYRDQANLTTHSYVRTIKHDVAKLRVQLVKLEEEIKHMTRGRRLLVIGIQEMRWNLSTNQRSISTFQRKTKRRTEESVLNVLGEEAQVLSQSKRLLEQQLVTAKTHLQYLDGTRRSIRSKIEVLSRTLSFDPQNFQVYYGPVRETAEAVSKQKHYSTTSTAPSNTFGDRRVVKSCADVAEVISMSRAVRGDIRSLIQSIKGKRSEAHGKVTSTMSTNIEEGKTRKHKLVLERGKVKKVESSVAYQKHEEEIALGLALGPISENDRSVCDKMERPLSQLRPASAIEERDNLKKMTRTIIREMHMAESGQKLERKIRENSFNIDSYSQTLRVCRASLDHRCTN